MSPVEATKPENFDAAFEATYGKHFEDVAKDSTDKAKFKVGDYVRISRIKNVFEKSAYANWTRAIYRVREIKHTQPVTYLLTEHDGEPIDGGFYAEELQLTDAPEEFEVEAILKERKVKGKKQYFVKWLGYEHSADSWIDANDIRDI